MSARRLVLVSVVVLAMVGGGISTSMAASPPANVATTGAAQSAQTASPSPNLTVDAVARTSAPDMAGTHYYTVTIPNASDGASLESLRLNYSGTGVDLVDGLSHYRSELERNPETENSTELRLVNTSISATNTTVVFDFADDGTLHAGDELWVAISGVVNPNTTGPIHVGVHLNPDQGGPQGVATLDIGLPAPSISPQGVIGESTRIGLHDPEGADGFIVAYDSHGSIIGTHALDPHQELHMDIGIEAFVEEQYRENGMTVRLVAHYDSNGNGEFDPSVDDRYRIDGNPVEATVENAVFSGGTTTTTPTSTSPPSTTTSTTTADGTTVTPTTSTTSTTVPGFHLGAVLLSLLGLAVLARRA